MAINKSQTKKLQVWLNSLRKRTEDDKAFEKSLKRGLRDVLIYMDIDDKGAKKLAGDTMRVIKREKKIENIEKALRKQLKGFILREVSEEKLYERANRICYNPSCGGILKYVLGKRILDVGSGDGFVAQIIKEDKPDVNEAVGVDIVNYNKASIKFSVMDAHSLSKKLNEKFATSLLITVLHHCRNPLTVLRETMRVTRKRIIVIESIYRNPSEKEKNMFFDWFYNRVLHDSGVPVPFSFKTACEWRSIFEKYGLTVIKSEPLGIDQPIVPEFHWLFVLDIENNQKPIGSKGKSWQK